MNDIIRAGMWLFITSMSIIILVLLAGGIRYIGEAILDKEWISAIGATIGLIFLSGAVLLIIGCLQKEGFFVDLLGGTS